MPILNVQTQTIGTSGIVPRIIYVATNDNYLQVQATGYLNHIVSQGFSLSESDMALVETKASPSSAQADNGWFNVTRSGTNWSLTPSLESLPNGYIFVGNSQNKAVGVPMSGDATISNTGVVTVTGGGGGGLPFQYVAGFDLTPDTPGGISAIYTLAPGSARDSTNTYDLITTVSKTIDFTVVGLGGFDVAPNETDQNWYAIYVIGDSNNINPPGIIASLDYTGSIVFPAGYDIFRRIAWGGYRSAGSGFDPGLYDVQQQGVGNIRSYGIVDNGAFFVISSDTYVVYDCGVSVSPTNIAGTPRIQCPAQFILYMQANMSDIVLTIINPFNFQGWQPAVSLAAFIISQQIEINLINYNDGMTQYYSCFAANSVPNDGYCTISLIRFTDYIN